MPSMYYVAFCPISPAIQYIHDGCRIRVRSVTVTSPAPESRTGCSLTHTTVAETLQNLAPFATCFACSRRSDRGQTELEQTKTGLK